MSVTTGGVSVTTGYLWGAAGNQTSRTVDGDLQSQTWDAEGELVSTSSGDAESDTSNVYDANGTRLIRTDSTGVTVFLPGGQEVRSTDTTMSATRWYSFGGSTVAVRTGTGFGGVSSIVSDAHGTPLAQVNNTSLTAPVTMVRTDPFGAPRAGQTGTVAGRGFLGAPADATGLTLLGARYYDPGTGTFLSVDPELSPGNPAQFNAYVYSGNNPVTWADPTGRNWWNDMVKNVGKGLKTAGKWIHDNRAVITGVVVGVALTAGCMALTAGVGTVGCAVLGGMAGGAVTNVMTQAQSKKKFNVGSLVTDTLVGGAFGLLGPAAGALGKAIAPAASAAVRTISNAVKPALSKAPTAFRPAAAGGLKPSLASAGKPANAASCAINSFVTGTLVLLANGAKAPIETIKLGDEIVATNPETGETSPEPVVATITGTGTKDLVKISVEAADGGLRSVTATSGHPFWVPDIAAWVKAGDLAAGQSLLTASDGHAQITMVERYRDAAAVHNLTVANTHTYYVDAGGDPLLTHNCSGGSNIVYRGLAAGEDASTGITARAPGAASVSPLSHVAGKVQSPWISTTKSLDIATSKYGQNGVVAIDLDRVASEVVDVSAGFTNGGRMSSWAIADQEVLIRGAVPPDAIVGRW